MDSTIRKKIQNFVRKFYIEMILEDKFKNHNNISNVMITKYFNRTMYNIKSADSSERRKFFHAFRTKYIDDFKRNRKLFTTLISNFKRRKAFVEFKSKFTASEWDKINGDKLARYLAIKENMFTKEDFEDLFNIIKIVDK
jgi:hypothetical protein